MSANAFSRIFTTTANTVFKRFVVSLIRTSLIYVIALLFVHIPTLVNMFMTMGKNDDRHEKQKKVRSKLVDSSDPSSSYRAMRVLNELENQPEEDVRTLADIPDLCLERFADKETMGVRQILDVEDEKQPNGKIFKKFLLGEYQFRTYREACQQIENIGRGFLSLGLRKGDRILIYCETRPDWLLTAFAAFRHGLTLVTLYSTLGEEAVKHGINESQVKFIVTSQDLTEKLDVRI